MTERRARRSTRSRASHARGAAWRALALLVVALPVACGDDATPRGAASTDAPSDASARRDPPPADAGVDDDPRRRDGPPGAVWSTVDELLAERAAVRHPDDGSGRLTLAEPADPVRAGGRGRYVFDYEVGAAGLSPGALLEFVAPGFWGWSPAWFAPEVADELGPPGRVELDPLDGVRWETLGPPGGRCLVRLVGRALQPGETLRVRFGAGAEGVRVDRYAERAPALYLRVDADGDGVSALVPEPPLVVVLPGPAAQLVAHLPSAVRPGEPARLTLAVLDALGNAGPEFVGALSLADADPSLGLPGEVQLGLDDAARATLAFTPRAAGVFRVRVEGPDGLVALSNPMLVADSAEPILWADLHGHSSFSDGTGAPDDYFAYARDVAALDVVALTDHDHWGLPFLDEHPVLVERLREAARAAHEPGRFVVLFGFEWTSWIHGHRHVLGFEEPEALPWISSIDPATDDPRELWAVLRGRQARTFAHHTSGEPVPTNWDVPPDPELEPVVEVASVHGSSEAADGARPVRGSRDGHYVRDALQRGYRLGFVGSGDSHDGHPGLAHLSAGTGGVAALLGASLTRGGVRDALDARRCYATSGARILLRTALDGQRMGSVVPAGDEPSQLVVVVHGTAPLGVVEVIRGAEVVARQELEELRLDTLASFELAPLRPGEFVYARVRQLDGHSAWSSPFFVE